MDTPLLVFGAAANAAASLLHIGCIIFGAPWYRFFGAGERMARLAEAGSWRPTLITSGIVLVLAAWSLYALSGAGIVRALPAVRPVLCVVTGIYLLRGFAGFALALTAPGRNGLAFWWWSSAICLAIGLVHGLGTWQAWSHLSHAPT